jgi:uncharacterized protein YjbI with pentapeptide repeats
MSDLSVAPDDGDVPVNPYSLMEAVNDTSDDARTGWFIFLGLMTYLLVAVAGISHKELLLAKDVPLPIIQVTVDLQRFFLFAPIVLCFLHFGILIQHAMLARKVLEFDTALKALEPTDVARHPLRLELHSYIFTQALAGPQRSPLMGFFLHAQAWLTLVVLPLLLLLYIQVSFLPYHDVEITFAHRLTLLLDILILLAIGCFLTRIDTSFWHALWRTIVHHPVMFAITTLTLAAIAMFALFIATVPGEALDRVAPQLTPSTRSSIARLMPFTRDALSDSVFGFRRNLVVKDTDLVDDKSVTAGQVSISLRNRDLRNAKFDRSDLHQADFTGAILDGASLMGADLRGAQFSCPDINELNLTGNRLEAQCASLRGANLTRVRAAGAKFNGADLTGANLEAASLEDAELSFAAMKGANFATAHLERADITGGVALQGANFLLAQLQGADFSGGNLHGVDLSSAGLQGALFTNAKLYGANLREAELEGADLTRARLAGADLGGAKLFGADLRGAAVWQTQPPVREMTELADLADLQMAPLEDSEVTSAKIAIEGIEDGVVRARVTEALTGILDKGSAQRWRNAAEHTAWQDLIRATARLDAETYRTQLTGFLGNMSCRARWSNASVATGVVKRAQGSRFKGNSEAIYVRVGAPECPASMAVSKRLMRDLSAAVDNAKGLQTALGGASSAASGSGSLGTSSGLGGLSGPYPVGGGNR